MLCHEIFSKVMDHNEVTLHYLTVIAEYLERKKTGRPHSTAALPIKKPAIEMHKEGILYLLTDQKYRSVSKYIYTLCSPTSYMITIP